MLDHFADVQTTIFGRTGARGGEGGDGTMPGVWNHSYRELDRCVTRMRRLAETPDLASPAFRKMYVNLRGWYLTCEKMPKVSPQKTVRRGAEIVELPRTVRLHIKRHGELVVVLLAVAWVSAEFVGEPYLPRELLEVAA